MQRKVPFMKVAESFGECVNVLDNGPLTDENFNLFYTEFSEPYRIDIIKQLNFRLKNPTSPTTFKFILAGHRGVGKSTELLRVSRLCSEYKTIFINVSDSVSNRELLYTNVLMHIADELMKFGVTTGIIDEDDEVLDPLMDYWDKEVQYSEVIHNVKEEKKDLSVGAGVGGKLATKFELLKFLKTALTLNVKGDVSFSYGNAKTSTVDEVINTVISKNNSLFIHALNVLVHKIRENLGNQKLLLIINEFDRDSNLILSKQVFKDHIDAFLGIDVDMIYSYPVHLLYDPEYSHIRDKFTCVYQLGVVEIIGDDRHYMHGGIDLLKELVYKRIKRTLIDDNALELAIKMSGGLIRDVFSMLIDAATSAAVCNHDIIELVDVQKSIRTLEERYIKLIRIDDAFKKVAEMSANPYQQVTSDLRELLRTECVLEYSNNRYMVHPIVLRFLKRIGRTVNEYE